MNYTVLAYYYLNGLKDPQKEIKRQKAFLQELDATSRIYISEAGINAQLSIATDQADSYINWLLDDPRFSDIDVKGHLHFEQAFPRLSVKYRKQLVAMDEEVDLCDQGEYLSPRGWKEMLEHQDENTILIDVRNSYESKVGHFSGAIQPDLETFREFPEFARSLKEDYDPQKTKVMMYCTGGIRCEFYSPLMKKLGFKKVYQLKGGVIRYGLEEGNEHWEGKLFVFDDRLVVPIDGSEASVISHCSFCDCECDRYHNCANMDCNQLFLCCDKCIEEQKGCCSESCYHEGRVRCLEDVKDHKPFRRLSYEEKLSFKN